MLRRPVWAVIFALLTAAAYLAVSMLVSLLPFAGTAWGSLAEELLLAAFGALVLLAMGRGRVLTDRGRGFSEGLKAGGFLIAVLALGLMGTLAMWEQGPIGSLEAVRFFLMVLAIGLAEELTFRGVIQNLLAGVFGRDTRRGLWRTVGLSGLIFGLAHMTNLLSGAAPLGVVMQTAAAVALGMYLGAVYARCGNIWPLVLLHGFNDLVAMLASGSAGPDAALEAVSAYGPEKLVTVGLYLALTAFLLRKRKLDGILEKASGPV